MSSVKIKQIFSKVIFSKITLSRETASLLAASLIMFFHNAKFLLDKARLLFLADFDFAVLLRLLFEVSLHLFILFALFFICSFRRRLFKIVLLFCLFLSTVCTFFYNKFGIIIDQAIVANAMDNLSEGKNLISYSNLTSYLTLFFIVPALLVCRFEIVGKSGARTFVVLFALFAAFFTRLATCNHEVRRGAIVSYQPVNLIDSLAEYYSDFYPAFKNRKTLQPISNIIPDIKLSGHKLKNLKVILIIGESARAKNFSINGYTRDTNPELKKEKNLISFKTVFPCSNLTSQSVSCMLSWRVARDFLLSENNEESVIKAFENLGFSTAWFSTQKAVGDSNVLLLTASQAQKYFFSNSISKKVGGSNIYDEYLLGYLDQEIEKAGDNFIILHMQGSHFLFDDRYPKKFRKFIPICDRKDIDLCAKQELVNSYDNSILYTDYFISEVIKKLRDKSAILFYVSDHGQFLGEGNVYYHGSSDSIMQKEHMVPMFLWMSDSALKSKFYHKKFDNAATKKDEILSHDNLFDSLLDCSGADSKFLKKRNLSLCGE